METNEKTKKEEPLLSCIFDPNTATPSSESSFDAATAADAATTADLITTFFLHHDVDETATTPQHITTHNNKPLF
eukprot:15366579-Ditylum_brightwellii.AAC.1